MSRGLDPCIHVYTQEQWESLMQKARRLNQFTKEERRAIRWLVGDYETVEMDKQGRILIPGHLAQYAGIKDRVYFVRMLDWFEIWDPETYEKELAETEELVRSGNILSKAWGEDL